MTQKIIKPYLVVKHPNTKTYIQQCFTVKINFVKKSNTQIFFNTSLSDQCNQKSKIYFWIIETENAEYGKYRKLARKNGQILGIRESYQLHQTSQAEIAWHGSPSDFNILNPTFWPELRIISTDQGNSALGLKRHGGLFTKQNRIWYIIAQVPMLLIHNASSIILLTVRSC